MRRNLLLSVCFLMASVLFAGPVTKQQAQEMAKSFIQNRLAAGGGHRASANPQIDLSGEVSGLYVFNVDKDNGYVIVSNDDCAEPVLGYADKGSFDMQNIPRILCFQLRNLCTQVGNTCIQLVNIFIPSLYPNPTQVVLKYYPSICKPFGLGYVLGTPWVHLG